jgi:hypothetical protein
LLQKRLQGLCWSLLQRVWWPSQTLDHVQWTRGLLLSRVCIWSACTRPVLAMGAGQVQCWGFRNGALHRMSSSTTRPCRNSSLVQREVPGRWWTPMQFLKKNCVIPKENLSMQLQFLNGTDWQCEKLSSISKLIVLRVQFLSRCTMEKCSQLV